MYSISNEKAIEICNLGISAYQNGNFQKALDNFDLAIKLNSFEATFYLHKGHSNIQLKNYSDAIENFQAAFKLNQGYFIQCYAGNLEARILKENLEKKYLYNFFGKMLPFLKNEKYGKDFYQSHFFEVLIKKSIAFLY